MLRRGSQAQPVEIHTDKHFDSTTEFDSANAQARALSPVPSHTMNRSQTTPSFTNSKVSNGTIRTVPADSLQITDNTQTETPFLQPPRSFSPFNLPSYSSPPRSLPIANGAVRNISSEFGASRILNNVQTSDETNGSRSTSPGPSQWSSAVGGAGLGKSGRVIERLMSDNDALRRDLNLERINADTYKQDSRNTQTRMDVLAEKNERDLHEAAITKALLKRRERLLADVQGQVEGEKAKANAALARERGWRDQMDRSLVESKEVVERTLADSKAKIEEAQAHAAMMDTRNKVMEDHWAERNALVRKTVDDLSVEIESLVVQRRKDDRRMNMLQELCDQQHDRLEALTKDKETIAAQFEAYKMEQENALLAIKSKAAEQERKNDDLIKESQRVLGELKWAIAVKRNVPGAQ